MDVRIQFLGGAGTVPGSKYLVQHGSDALLVDCGLFQGYKALRLRNRTPLPIVPNQIRAVVLTHAHIDHSGYLPVLAREGFHGKVWCTHATRDLCEILLPDSAHLQEEDAAFANRHGFSKHSPALPLYTVEDAQRALRLLRPQPLYQRFEPIPGWQVQFFGAGHILGAASVLIEVGGRRLLFSGDLGRADDTLMFPPDPPPAADAVVVESTYGNRLHPAGNLIDGRWRKHLRALRQRLAEAHQRTTERLERLGFHLFAQPHAGMFLWARHPAIENASTLAYQAAEQDILLGPGHLFGLDLSPSPWLRFNVAFCEDEALWRFLAEATGTGCPPA